MTIQSRQRGNAAAALGLPENFGNWPRCMQVRFRKFALQAAV
ncbi:hypothetical protein OAL55_00660 [Verrucomicrobiales bacterium]|nr:hypothetical protein [Verrucomicrobiales bacterium]MDC0275865.1 hypothetical protein [Verrucomicrobiales bacterium]MDC0321848.1 hypothetical protein [Verrucomicrobiales bacterium]